MQFQVELAVAVDYGGYGEWTIVDIDVTSQTEDRAGADAMDAFWAQNSDDNIAYVWVYSVRGKDDEGVI